MEHSLNPEMNWQTGAPAVSRLLPKVDLRVDYGAIARLHTSFGPKLAEATIAQARADLAHRLQLVSVAHADCSFETMAAAARRIRGLSLEIGLPQVRRASDHVLDCLAQGDATALAATVSRLSRIGACALQEVDALREPGG